MKFKFSRILPLMLCTGTMAFAAVVPARALPPSGEEIFEGMDVSEFQGDIDFERAASDGIRAVYIRVGVGSSYVDPYFHENYEKAKDAGLYVGFYHYVTARSVEEGRQQAEFFASLVTGREPDMRLAMDFESFGSLNAEEVNEISREYLRTLTSTTGKDAVVYSDTSNAINVFDEALAREYPLWVAEYGVEEPADNGKWDSWVGFQFADVGRVAGISGDVDRDRFTDGILLDDRSAIAGERKIPVRSDSQRIIVYVRPGDTLFRIAREYDTTVPAIVRENNIVDPNRIFVGQRLTITKDARDSGAETYIVRSGDTLSSIAGRFGVSVSAIVSANNIENPNVIFEGETLRIPSAKKAGTFYAVRNGDTLSRISTLEGVPVSEIAGINRLRNPDVIRSGQQLKLY
ncbi:MAG: LysM peptidoglycan-binding domain-containing protein [Clostridia bacterium]|nr:LysM peptidoglycan-binding domain-containing protein [Clostridia bacterium]